MSDEAVTLLVRRIAQAAQDFRALPFWRVPNPVSCTEVAAVLPAILDRESEAPAALVRHVQSCLTCQAELARYRRVLRLLHQLRSAEVTPPPGVVSEVLAALEEVASRRMIGSLLTGRRMAYGAAFLSAGAATAALVALAVAKGRRSAPATS
jgi:hypothetical protein